MRNPPSQITQILSSRMVVGGAVAPRWHDCHRFCSLVFAVINADWADAVNAAGFFTTNEHEWARMAGAVNVDSYAGVQSRYTNYGTLMGIRCMDTNGAGALYTGSLAKTQRAQNFPSN